MTAYDLSLGCVYFIQCAFDHLVGDCVGEENQQIRTADLLIQARAHLGENLGLAFVILTYFFILAHHAVVAADNNNAHENPPLRMQGVYKG